MPYCRRKSTLPQPKLNMPEPNSPVAGQGRGRIDDRRAAPGALKAPACRGSECPQPLFMVELPSVAKAGKSDLSTHKPVINQKHGAQFAVERLHPTEEGGSELSAIHRD